MPRQSNINQPDSIMRARSQRFACQVGFALLFAGLGLRPAMADDIDLYAKIQAATGKPNVLIVMDSSASWDASIPSFQCSSSGVVSSNNQNAEVGALQCALYNAVASIPGTVLEGNLNLGLMLFGKQSNPGGYFRIPTSPGLWLMDQTGVNNFKSAVVSLDRNTDKSNKEQIAETMQEAWAFFKGNGTQGLSGTTYTTSPIVNNCQANFVIYIGGAFSNSNAGTAGSSAFPALVSAGASNAQQQQIAILPPQSNKAAANWADEWARFMYQGDLTGNQQNIVTYTITVTDGSANNNAQGYIGLTNSMATNGGGGATVVQQGDVAGLTDALLKVFNEVQAVNSAFASVSLPISVNGQGTYLNQVYVGMFRPDQNAAPRWMGNLKQYQLGYDSTNAVVLQDANGQAAISNAKTGFVSPNATSFWTADPPKTFSSSGYGSAISKWPSSGFWQNAPSGKSLGLDAPDGEVVEKGGAGEMLRAQYLTDQSQRRLFTCASAGTCPVGSAMPGFNTTTTGLASDLVNWVRGTDVKAANSSSAAGAEVEAGPGSSVTVRGSIHGDVLHSRPAVVNYPDTNNIVVFYGTNDGVFHAINGNPGKGFVAKDGTVVRPGGELWGFVAPEFFGNLTRVYQNSPQVQYSTTPSGITPTPTPRNYYFDGSTAVYQDLRTGQPNRVYLYLTARRGGRLVYALDVTDPFNPTFLWRITNNEIPELGQTWSQPRVIRVKGYANPVLVMGAGYDPAEDSDPSPGTNSMGRGIIMLDAITGKVVWAALPTCNINSTMMASGGACAAYPDSTTQPGLARAIPSDVAVLDRNGDGYVERVYVGDVGGNLWRADLEVPDSNGNFPPSKWTLGKFARLGGAATSNSARKFLYPPDIVPTATFDAVMAGTGDREHPLYSGNTSPGTAYNVVNRMYMLKDPNTTTPQPQSWAPVTESTLFDATANPYVSTVPGYSTYLGYYVTLGTGEKVVNAPLTVAGYTYFGTNTPTIPSPNACYPLGIARGYSLNFLSGTGQNGNRYVVFDGGGLPPSPVFGMVSIPNADGSSSLQPVLIGGGNQLATGGGNSTSSLGSQKVVIPGIGKRKRTHWYVESDRH